jgi:reductive dehalogenase
MRIFSYRNRPVHLGQYPMERVRRSAGPADLSSVPPFRPVSFDDTRPESLTHAMAPFIGMFDVIRDGPTAALAAEIPSDPVERADHLKAASYYFDVSQAGACRLDPAALLAEPVRNPGIDDLVAQLRSGQPKSLSAGIDTMYAEVLEAAEAPLGGIGHHTCALVFLVEFPRDPWEGEPGTEWLVGTQEQRAATLAALTATIISSYLRLFGHQARAHSGTTTDVDLNRLAVAAGLARVEGEGAGARLVNPFVGSRFGLAAVTTTLDIAPDAPLAAQGSLDRLRSHGPAWWVGRGTAKHAFNREPYRGRAYRMGAYPFERIKRRDDPTTFIDEPRVPRFPKRSDFFARALFGDMGKAMQEAAKGGMYVLKSPIGYCCRRALGALILLQFGEARGPVSPTAADPDRNADNLKAASYYLSCDAVGLCRVPEWAFYSHDAAGNPMAAYHKHSVTMLIDQGHETMDGASGDDWISVAQSMRAYLRFSLLGGIVGEQIRRLGYSARVHSSVDGDVLQPPLLLLSGLGEVSRIGEVILNPYLGPRLKSGSVTTDMPMTHDKPIDFGLQHFCESCNKCARECPSGAITAGPKLMYNGYEIWKSDAEKCARYRLTNQGGGMCGRCMKTCPWNLEGLFADSAFRWAAINLPAAAKTLAKLDDALGRGAINPVKKWWWDVELNPKTMQYVRAGATHKRGLNTHLDLKYEDQTLAVYPADVMPPPYPVAHPLNREQGIARYRAMLTPGEYKRRLAAGETEGLAPPFMMPEGAPPVFQVVLKKRVDQTPDIATYEFVPANGGALPRFTPGAHIDVVIAPEYQRQFSLAGDPADTSKYLLGVQVEAGGRGGSKLMHRIFREGRRVFVSPPRNHFPLEERARFSLLMASGIGVTPMLPMAHRLDALGRDFVLHYSARSRERAGFIAEIEAAPWRNKVVFHLSEEGGRADIGALVPDFSAGHQLYCCGGARYMAAVLAAAAGRGWPEDHVRSELFAVPEDAEFVNYDFVLRLARTGREIVVPADKSAVEALAEIGIAVDTKCSDGICGVCKCKLLSGAVEHRDYVLSKKEREANIILCSSRAAEKDGRIEVDL